MVPDRKDASILDVDIFKVCILIIHCSIFLCYDLE